MVRTSLRLFFVLGAALVLAACDGSDSTLPPKSDPAAFTQAFVQQAIDRYDNEGREATVAFYNTKESVDGQWYVFISDESTNRRLSHPIIPDLVGRKAQDIRGSDGYPTGLQNLLLATQDGAWSDYTWVNPVSGVLETKHSWLVRHNGLIFGSGWYEPGPSKSDPAAFTQAFVQRAVQLYDAVGRDLTLAFYNTPESADETWYVFVIDENENLIAHQNPTVLGKHVDELGSTIDGEKFSELEVTEAGLWTDYLFVNPATGAEELKHSWGVRHDGLVFGSGWYEPAN